MASSSSRHSSAIESVRDSYPADRLRVNSKTIAYGGATFSAVHVMLALHVPHGVLGSSVFNWPVAFAFESNLPANVVLSIVAEKLPPEIFALKSCSVDRC